MKNHCMTMIVVVGCAAVFGSPALAFTDDNVELAAGQWIRVATTKDLAGIAKAGAAIEGSLESLDENRIVLRRNAESQPVAVPRDAVARLDVRKRASSRGKGALIGAALGLGVAVAAGVASPGGGQNCIGACVSGGVIGVLTVPAGALLGLALGHGSEWKENIPLERTRLSFCRTPGHGIRIAIAWVL